MDCLYGIFFVYAHNFPRRNPFQFPLIAISGGGGCRDGRRRWGSPGWSPGAMGSPGEWPKWRFPTLGGREEVEVMVILKMKMLMMLVIGEEEGVVGVAAGHRGFADGGGGTGLGGEGRVSGRIG